MNEKTAYMHRYASPLGDMLIAASGESVTGLWFYGARHFAAGLEENAREGCPQVIRDTVRWLDIYFSGAQPDFMPPVELHGTDFCRAVWAELMKIPRGETRSYGDVAKRLGVNSRRQSAPRSDAIPFASSCPVIGSSAQTAALSDTPRGFTKKSVCWRLREE